ncbi:MAG TPA: helix-turn-helix transcriptional regulator [Streptosporangiaceae bacterium]|jgi:DNA-binding Xre family transcriptional regulator|nr:helix-turn-helix transcriptional regulator [Streptosporangiaceae bacterium]
MPDPVAFDPGQRRRRPRTRPLLRTMLGDVLRRKRLEQGRTLADVARAAKVSLPYLSELERGRKEASSEILAAICAALGLDLADLLAEVGRDLSEVTPARVIKLDAVRPDSPAGAVAPPAPAGSAPPASPTCLLAA